MTDTPEQQRIDAVDAQRLADDEKAAQRREANKLRKRKQRAEEREAREQTTKQQQAKLAAEAEAKDQERIRQERIALIISELTPPILPAPNDDPEYWPWVESEIELYLIDRFGAKPDFEKMYHYLSLSPEGQLILRYFGVEPLPLPPPGWTYLLGKSLQLFKQPHGPSIELWENFSDVELEARAKDWKECTKAPTPSPVKYKPDDSRQELWDFFKQRVADLSESARAEISQKKKEYSNRIRVLEMQWKIGRAFKAKETGSAPL